MLDTLRISATAFAVLSAGLIADFWALDGSISAFKIAISCVTAALILGLIWLTAFWSRHSQERLARVFGISVRVLILLVAAFVFLQACLLIFLSIRSYNNIGSGLAAVNFRLSAILLFLGALTLGASVTIATSIGTLAQKLKTRALGIVVTANEQPALWEFVNTIATKLGAVPPKHIVLGLEPIFYITAADVELAGTSQWVGGQTMKSNVALSKTIHLITGETMFLSLPLMRTLSKDELGAVVGHELGHFQGMDTAYTLRFVPIYHGVQDAMDAIESATEHPASQLIALPASTILMFYLSEFAKAEREIGRERELKADEAGVRASSGHALISALVKVATFAPIWPELCRYAIEASKSGKMYDNMSEAFVEYTRAIIADVQTEELANAVMGFCQTHPTDTHPPLEARIRALGLPSFDFDGVLDIDEEPASSLLPGLEKIEQFLSARTQQFLAAH